MAQIPRYQSKEFAGYRNRFAGRPQARYTPTGFKVPDLDPKTVVERQLQGASDIAMKLTTDALVGLRKKQDNKDLLNATNKLELDTINFQSQLGSMDKGDMGSYTERLTKATQAFFKQQEQDIENLKLEGPNADKIRQAVVGRYTVLNQTLVENAIKVGQQRDDDELIMEVEEGFVLAKGLVAQSKHVEALDQTRELIQTMKDNPRAYPKATIWATLIPHIEEVLIDQKVRDYLGEDYTKLFKQPEKLKTPEELKNLSYESEGEQYPDRFTPTPKYKSLSDTPRYKEALDLSLSGFAEFESSNRGDATYMQSIFGDNDLLVKNEYPDMWKSAEWQELRKGMKTEDHLERRKYAGVMRGLEEILDSPPETIETILSRTSREEDKLTTPDIGLEGRDVDPDVRIFQEPVEEEIIVPITLEYVYEPFTVERAFRDLAKIKQVAETDPPSFVPVKAEVESVSVAEEASLSSGWEDWHWLPEEEAKKRTILAKLVANTPDEQVIRYGGSDPEQLEYKRKIFPRRLNQTMERFFGKDWETHLENVAPEDVYIISRLDETFGLPAFRSSRRHWLFPIIKTPELKELSKRMAVMESTTTRGEQKKSREYQELVWNWRKEQVAAWPDSIHKRERLTEWYRIRSLVLESMDKEET